MEGRLGRVPLAAILRAVRRIQSRVGLYFLTHDSFLNAPALPDSGPTLFASFDTVSNDSPNTNPTAQRFTPVPYDPLYCT